MSDEVHHDPSKTRFKAVARLLPGERLCGTIAYSDDGGIAIALEKAFLDALGVAGRKFLVEAFADYMRTEERIRNAINS